MGVGALFTQDCDGLRAGSTGPYSLASRTARLDRYPARGSSCPGGHIASPVGTPHREKRHRTLMCV